ncbi:MAG: 23S rRNA (adenine(2503)-C(2))-methyltransferase RlmN [Lentisphaerae bacterium]|nr:23S rRNA (adenine(2503)-C(2))-methyltransferase RlmN [Lentisphaerota bacterium]MBT4818547.1 23S rRNA (adenine(2503)-C(2))-methyltransferase RlmN [Lentisphaerota bacterium]MBT5604630.1 23S rRNA (adenine(2503)-C(2))-methyltransferase RlmN [Lentisphaerota bacterium]MBT7057432.1 23S rRNA (adenine(2503)-C(2))-methyltransferase RlmN [Lentisphaerota bacterium]MBT7845505.1 23S rRNA (adenine(2503)-C(2))-methyltransferase RlmN [Lentisphaerota bacterium]
MTTRLHIKDQVGEPLERWLEAHGQKAFRLKQIEQWLYQHWATDFAEMRNLSTELRSELENDFTCNSVTQTECLKGAGDTRKYLLTLEDGETIETVLIRSARRETVCVSTQVGCPVQCAFCASGRGGLVRNLTSAEIVDQVFHVCRDIGRKITNVVVMGIGEPLLNLTNLIKALEQLCDSRYFGLGARRVTISTSGIVPGIQKLADMRQQWKLALSLHATRDELRAQFIPRRYRYSLEQVLDACADYREATGRMVTLEYALIAGRNDSRRDATELAEISRRLDAKINLIALNPISDALARPTDDDVKRFCRQLEDHNGRVTVRLSRGEDIQGACGQLRHHRKRKEADVRCSSEP